MLALMPHDPPGKRRLVAQTALCQMTAWLDEGYQLHGLGLPSEAHVSVAMGFAGAMRINHLLDVLRDDRSAALSLVAAVISGRCAKSSPFSELVLIHDTVVAAEQLSGNRTLEYDTTNVRLFMWRLNKMTQRLGSAEIVWDNQAER